VTVAACPLSVKDQRELGILDLRGLFREGMTKNAVFMARLMLKTKRVQLVSRTLIDRRSLFLCSYFAQDFFHQFGLQPLHYAMHGLCDGVVFGARFRSGCNRGSFQTGSHNAVHFFGLGDNRR
jgi:hypothetical protein